MRCCFGYGKESEMKRRQLTDGVALVNDVFAFIRRFVSLSPEQACVCAFWIIHTHAISAAEYTPYLNIYSALPRSGKTRLLEVLRMLVSKPWFTGRTTCSALTRTIELEHPTLLVDESDTAFNSERDYSEALRGILNTGFERDGVHSISVAIGTSWKKKDFSTFCPKAIAGIGKLPPTISDRAIPIELERQAKNQSVERLKKRKVQPDCERIQKRISVWVKRNLKILKQAEPDLPQALNDRQQDVCEPLLAIADLTAGTWPASLRSSLLQLYLRSFTSQDEEPVIRLLKDMKHLFDSRKIDRIRTQDALAALNDDETAPWSEFVRGRPLSDAQLARLLKPVKIYPRTIRVRASTPKGYMKDDFKDAWDKYLP
jgi:Protein of unknown function (DUF3631)